MRRAGGGSVRGRRDFGPRRRCLPKRAVPDRQPKRPHAITVTQVKYFNQANNRFQTEAIRNLRCAAGATCTTHGDNLRDAEGEDLTRFVFVLKNEGGENRHETGIKVSRSPR